MTVNGTKVLNAITKLFGIAAVGLPTKVKNQVGAIVLLGLLKGYDWQNILNLIKQFNCESGNGKDYKFVEYNNGWGMMKPTWSSYVIGSVGIEGQGIYPNIFASTLDRFTWDKRNGLTGREIDYLGKVQQKGYNSSTNYHAVVASYNSHSSEALATALVIPALLIGGLYSISKI